MKKVMFALMALLIPAAASFAQTKVFREVGEEISSRMEPILQDGALMGYLMFTALERADKDSVNYRISIMDENLNDIGEVKFRELPLTLESVAFEQDVICLAYLKSNVVGQQFKDKSEYKAAVAKDRSGVFTQFINLDGKVINTGYTKVQVKYATAPTRVQGYKLKGDGKLDKGIQLRNIPGRGFACFYGDEAKKNLLTYNTKGQEVWTQVVKDRADLYVLQTARDEIYILTQTDNKKNEGGFTLLSYSLEFGKSYPKYKLMDNGGRELKVMAFDNDPATGRPFIAGNIIDVHRGKKWLTLKHHKKGIYNGVFSIDLEGGKKNTEHFTYWSDGSQADFSKAGRLRNQNMYAVLRKPFRDYNGNTYFAGSSYSVKPRWGAIIPSVITLPLVVPPVMILGMAGTKKFRYTETAIVMQDASGKLKVEAMVPGDRTVGYVGKYPIHMSRLKTYEVVKNMDTKASYLIIDDVKNSYVYNVHEKKVVRTIPHREGGTFTALYPAKEGYMMVAEYNKKERYRRLSIEAL